MNDRAPAGLGTATWPAAARALAARVTRRDRTRAFLLPLAAGLALGAGAAWAARLVGLDAGAEMTSIALVPVVAGLLVGARAARRIAPTAAADAAWALDRLADGRGRGLVAATIDGPAASEAAWGSPPLVPPRTQLKAPEGLVAALAAALLFATPFVAAPSAHAGKSGREGSPASKTAADAGAAGRLDAEAQAEGREAAAARRVREALGIPAGAPVGAIEIGERLAKPEALAAAKAAAPEGSSAAAALGQDGTAAASALARALAEGPAEKADALRRDAAALRASGGVPAVPLARRELVARYLAARLLAKDAANTGGTHR